MLKVSSSGYPKEFFKDWFTHGYERAKRELEFRLSSALAIATHKRNSELNPSQKKEAVEDVMKLLRKQRKALNPKNKKKLTRFTGLPRGSHLALTTNVGPGGSIPLLACAWADKTNKTSIGTSGHILAGKPIQRTTFKTIFGESGVPSQDTRHRTFPIPSVFERLFVHLPKIDVHDHLRQGTLALEKSWATHSWSKRVFSTVLGMSITDSYLAFCFGLRDNEKPSFPDYLNRLAYQLVHNTFDESAQSSFVSPGPARRVQSSQPRSPAVKVSHEQHALLNLCLLDAFRGAATFHSNSVNVLSHLQVKRTLAGNVASTAAREKPNYIARTVQYWTTTPTGTSSSLFAEPGSASPLTDEIKSRIQMVPESETKTRAKQRLRTHTVTSII